MREVVATRKVRCPVCERWIDAPHPTYAVTCECGTVWIEDKERNAVGFVWRGCFYALKPNGKIAYTERRNGWRPVIATASLHTNLCIVPRLAREHLEHLEVYASATKKCYS